MTTTEARKTDQPARVRTALAFIGPGSPGRAFLREAALLPVLIVVVIIGAIRTDNFFTSSNFIDIMQASAVLSMLVLAEALIVVAGKFDLSMESTFGIAAMTAVWLVMPTEDGGSGFGVSSPLAFLIAILLGIAIGAANAMFIVKWRLNAFVVTLGMLILLRGVTTGMSNGQTISGVPDMFSYIGTSRPLGIPLVVWIAAGMYLAVGFFMRNHRVGRSIYAIGGNPEAARTAGVNVGRVMAGLFVLAGFIAAFAGLADIGRFGGVPANHGKDLIFTVMAATVIGGISLKGGKGTVFGALTGVLLLGVIRNLLVLEQVKAAWIDAVYGGIILLALALSRLASGEQE